MKPLLSIVHIVINNDSLDIIVKKDELFNLLADLLSNNIACYCPVKEANLNNSVNVFYFDLIVFFTRLGHYKKYKSLLDKYIYKEEN